MPKKGKGKQAADGKQKSAKSSTDDLPQVWLPNQPINPSASFEFNYSQASPHLTTPASALTPPSSPSHTSPQPHSTADGPTTSPPTAKEQEEILGNGRSKCTSRLGRGARARLLGRNPDLFKYAQCSMFTVNYLGHLVNMPKGSGSKQTDILEAIDTAQRQGRLPWVTSNEDQRILSLSKYGIKVMDTKKQRVFSRHPLHCIADITYYEDTYGKHMLALRVGQLDTSNFNLFVYRSSDEAQAKDICLTLAQAFDTVMTKMQMEKNLHTSDLR